MRCDTAPVNAPRSWPKSSLSISESHTAAQSNTTNGPSLRGDSLWMALAAAPLPEPVSPMSSRVESVGAIRCSSAKICRIGRLFPTSSPSRSSAEGATSTEDTEGWNRSWTSPISSRAPGRRYASRPARRR